MICSNIPCAAGDLHIFPRHTKRTLYLLLTFSIELTYDYSFNSTRHGGQDLIWDSSQDLGKFGYRRVFSEDGDGVPFLHVNPCHIQHGHIHAYVSDDRNLMTVHSELSLSPAQMPVKTVSIAYRNGGNYSSILGNLSMSTITDSTIRRLEYLHLQDLTLERGYWSQFSSWHSAHAIYSYPEADHIELILRETLNSGGIKYMIQRPVSENRSQSVCIGLEKFYLPQGIHVLRRFVRYRKMGLYRLDLHAVTVPQILRQFVQLLGHETETMHSCVQLDMNREILQSSLFQHRTKHLK